MPAQMCHQCAVLRHIDCVVHSLAGPVSGRCLCYDYAHDLNTHPELTGHPVVQQRAPYGLQRDVDYELEPFEKFGPMDAHSANKYGKPSEDLEDSRSIARQLDIRNEVRTRYRNMDF